MNIKAKWDLMILKIVEDVSVISTNHDILDACNSASVVNVLYGKNKLQNTYCEQCINSLYPISIIHDINSISKRF